MKKYAERFSIVTGFLIAGLIFLSKWLYYDGISYTILGLSLIHISEPTRH